MAILVLKPRDDSGAATADDEIVLSAMDTRIKQRLITPQRVAIAAGAVLIAALAVYAYVEYGLTRTLTVGAERVTVSQVAYDTFREYIPVTGNVVPRTTVMPATTSAPKGAAPSMSACRCSSSCAWTRSSAPISSRA